MLRFEAERDRPLHCVYLQVQILHALGAAGFGLYVPVGESDFLRR
jgi:hypothetical protein